MTEERTKKDFVRFEIFNYPKTKKEIASWRPFETSTQCLEHKMKIVNSIENALFIIKKESPNGEYKEELLKFYFWGNNHFTMDGLALEYHVHVNTAQKWVNEFINKVGVQLGLFDHDQ